MSDDHDIEDDQNRLVDMRQQGGRSVVSDEKAPARGLLRQSLTLEAIELIRVDPSPDLAGIVEYFWIVLWSRGDRETYRQENLPHPSQHLVLDPQGRTGIFGLMREKFAYELAGSGRVIGLKFRPGMFAGFLGWPVSEMTDKVEPIAPVFDVPDEELVTRFVRLNNPADMADPLEDLLRAHLPAPDKKSEEAREIVSLIDEASDLFSVVELARRTGLNVRSLQRLFDRYVGASPKWVIDRYRMLEAVTSLNEGRDLNLTTLAHELGYFDQAHFSHAFTALTGKPPSSYRQDG